MENNPGLFIKNFTIFLLLFFFPLFLSAQDTSKTLIKVDTLNVDPPIIACSWADMNPKCDLVELQKLLFYPEEARKKGIQGEVIVKILIHKNGEIDKIEIRKSAGKLLDDTAINAVKQCHFTPAIFNSNPVTSWLSIPIKFMLRN
jgi:TonB family protein